MVTVIDSIGILTSSQKSDLESTPTPFHVRVEYVDLPKPLLNDAAKACVHGTNDVCVMVNPKGKFTFTFYGADVAPMIDGDTIGRSGNAAFKAGDWKGGVVDILSRAQALHGQKTAVVANMGTVVVQQAGPTQVIQQNVPMWPFIIGSGLALVLFFFVYRAYRKQQKATRAVLDSAREEVANLASENIKHDRWSSDSKQKSALPSPRITITREHGLPSSGRNVLREQPINPPKVAPYTPLTEREKVILREPVVLRERKVVHHHHHHHDSDRNSSDNFLAGMAVQSSIDQARMDVERGRAVPQYRSPEPEPVEHKSSYSSRSESSDGGGGGGSFSGGSDYTGGGGGDIDTSSSDSDSSDSGGGGGGGDFG